MKEKNRKIILYVALCIVTIGILFVVLKLNSNRVDNLLAESYVKKYIHEIKYGEIDNYIVEQPNAIIYVSNSSEEKSKNFEKKLARVIKNKNLDKEIVYININNSNIADINYQYAPVMIFYNKKEVSDIIDCSTLKTTRSIKKILKERNVLND